MAKEDKNQNLLIIAIVGIVAIVALMIFSRGASVGKAMTNSISTEPEMLPPEGPIINCITYETGWTCCYDHTGARIGPCHR